MGFEERKFWENEDSTKYINWNEAKKVRFTNLKKTSKQIAIKLPYDIYEKIKVKANALNIPYSIYLKNLIYKELNV